MKFQLYFSSVICLLFFSAQGSAGLDGKLKAQWQRYEATRSLALTKSSISRDEWEMSLQVDSPLTKEELWQLQNRQALQAEETKKINSGKSVLDLENLRHGSLEKVELFCSELPKGGMLHVHPGGTLTEETLTQIISRVKPTIHLRALVETFQHPDDSSGSLYPSEIEFLEQLVARYGETVSFEKISQKDLGRLVSFGFLKSGSHLFPRFQASFTLHSELAPDTPGVDLMEYVYNAFLARAHAEHVSYVELSEHTPMNEAFYRGLERWTEMNQKKFGVTVRFLETFNRLLPSGDTLKRALALLGLPTSWAVVGVNIAWDETHTPMLEQGQSLYLPLLRARLANQTALHAGSHAGELGDNRNPRDAMILGVERLGHGVRLKMDPVALEYARLHAMPVEINLTSNLRLSGVPNMAEHPFLHFLRLGLRASLSTDDEGSFGTDMNNECVTAITQSDVGYFELRQMVVNSIETAFVQTETRENLKTQLIRDLEVFENRWKAISPGGIPFGR